MYTRKAQFLMRWDQHILSRKAGFNQSADAMRKERRERRD